MEITAREDRIIREIMDELFKEDFMDVLLGRTSIFDWREAVSSVDLAYSHEELFCEQGVSIKTGATKIVIICDTLENWVIKLNMPFCREDFCGFEADYYSKAKGYGIEYYFAETKKFDEFNENTIYIQRRAQVDSSTTREIIDYFNTYLVENVLMEDCEGKDKDEIDELLSEYRWDMEDYDRAAAVFGWDKKLMAFLEENYINDLHEGNFGLIDGDWFMTDYSGFQRGEE